ncbi:shikimate kinase [Kluyvera intermedia]|uniref:shikimate kinase n=1 Tax=Kluyvera intermedia TaxID=61648 RepID=UPI00370C1667
MHLFLIGPGGAGKSTVGEKLAVRLGYVFVDLDAQFCERVANIREYLKSHGYEAYLEQNAALFDALLAERCHQNVVFALSSGFLATDIRPDIVERNRQRVREEGRSILLMPSKDVDVACGCIVTRQLKRGFELVRDKEEAKFRQRFTDYMALGDIQIFAMDSPEVIVHKIIAAL